MSWSVLVTSTSVEVRVVRSVIAVRVRVPLESPNVIGEYDDHVSICVGTGRVWSQVGRRRMLSTEF